MNKIRTLKDIPAKWRKRVEVVPGVISQSAAEDVARQLRYEARLAHLDDRTAQSDKFNRYALIIEREARKAKG